SKSDYVPLLGGLSIFLDTTIEEFTQDFQLKRTFESSDLTLGLFYSKKFSFNYNDNQILWNLYPVAIESINSMDYPDEVVALSAKYNYYVDDTFIFTAGFRYQESKREFERNLNNFGAEPTQANASDKWKKFLPLLSLSYITDDNAHLYLSYSKGMRTGGYNYRSDDTLTPYKAQITDGYELGYKRDFGNGLKLNTALFYNDIKDMRVVTFEDTLATFLTNAPKAYSYGFELDMSYQQDGLLIYGSLGLARAKYDSLMIDGVDYSGNTIIDTPNATASLGLKYDFSESLYLNASLSYMGKRYYNASNSAVEEGYTVSNLSIGYKDNGWEVELYGKNIFDSEYVDFMIATPSNSYYHFGTPRVVGVKISKDF
ncbi:MAG: TonB-dependent receptor, partial [Campylobacterota bacterium]|nr:TonB-dependent receptor [Campylobacterota bacterium]